MRNNKRKNQNNSIKIGHGVKFSGDVVIGNGSKIIKSLDSKPDSESRSFQNNIFWYIIAGVLIIIIATIFLNKMYEKKSELKLKINQVDGFDYTCDKIGNSQIQYEVANLGEKVSDFNNYYYVRGTQINNSCRINNFFNQSKNICLFEYVEDGTKETCRSSSRPLNTGKTVSLKYSFNEEANNFVNSMRNSNISSCEIDEQVYICTGLKKEQSCANTMVKITYSKCD